MTDRKRRIAVVAALVGLSCVVQAWRIQHAAVPAQDSVRFVRIAQKINRQGVLSTFEHESQQPLFPLSVWLAHRGLEFAAGPSPSSWAISAQLAAAVALALAVVPVYLIALRLVGPRAAAAAAAVFCVLPEVSRLGADGLSDSTHLLLFAVAFWAIVEYFRGQRTGDRGQRTGNREQGARGEMQARGLQPPGREATSGSSTTKWFTARWGRSLWLVMAGGATAAALMARVEAIVLPAALGVSMLAFELLRQGRKARLRLAGTEGHRAEHGRLVAAGGFVLGSAVVFVPYLAAVGSLTPRAAVARALGRVRPPTTASVRSDPIHQVWEAPIDPRPDECGHYEPPLRCPAPATAPGAGAATSDSAWQLADGRPMSFAYKEPSISLRRRGLAAAIGLLAEKLSAAFNHWVAALALVGLWQLRRTPVRRVDRFVQVFFVLYCLAVLYQVAHEGYLAARHLLPLVAATIGCAGYGLVATAGWIARGAAAKRPSGLVRSATAWAAVALAVALCLAEQVRPLHADRRAHRSAGEWLAAEADSPGAVLDTRGWTGLYSGRFTYGYEDAWEAFCDPNLAYVVLERRELEYPSDRSRTLEILLGRAAEPAAMFAEGGSAGPDLRGVMVYRWNGKRFSRWLAGVEQPIARTNRCNRKSTRL